MSEEQFQEWLNEPIAIDANGLNIPRRDAMNGYEEMCRYRECWAASRAQLLIELPSWNYALVHDSRFYWAEEVEAAIIKAGVQYK